MILYGFITVFDGPWHNGVPFRIWTLTTVMSQPRNFYTSFNISFSFYHFIIMLPTRPPLIQLQNLIWTLQQWTENSYPHQ
jgi:hypothetical protein